MYEDGKGVRQDDEEAAAWFRKAADQGYAAAQTLLGVMYEHGKGVDKDEAEALRLYRLSAAQKDAPPEAKEALAKLEAALAGKK